MPDSLHTLRFSWKFIQEIKENVLPNSLHIITFSQRFNQEIKDNILLKSIKKICLFLYYNLINNLPLWIEEVYIEFNDNDDHDKVINNLPITLEKLLFLMKNT